MSTPQNGPAQLAARRALVDAIPSVRRIDAEQVEAARRLLALQGPGAWPVCSVEAGLTMENGHPIAP